MPIANGRTPPQCRDGANFVRLGHCGEGHPELLSARFPARPFELCDALGRSQVVRQRILIPPSGGSNPPAPARPQDAEFIYKSGFVLGLIFARIWKSIPTCHFEILCCFRFHRILDKKPVGLLSADSPLDALKLPLLGIWRTPVCCRAASNVGKQIALP
jgi:hypothetical protein